MDDWEKFNETLLLEKEGFYSHLNMKDIADTDYLYVKKSLQRFSNNDLYVQRDTLLLGDAFENFQNICLEIYELGPAHFPSAPGLAW